MTISSAEVIIDAKYALRKIPMKAIFRRIKMNFKEFDLGGKKLRISAFSDNAVRIWISSDFKPTYF